jgi:hypothetical protein
MAYSLLLLLHSWLRWGVVLFGALALALAVAGWRASREWTPADRRAQLWFILFLDLQVALGVAVYLVGPIAAVLLANAAEAFRVQQVRFFAVEHALAMIAAAAVAHVMAVRSRRATAPEVRQRTWALGVAGTLALVALAIPWPFLPYGRPLLRR